MEFSDITTVVISGLIGGVLASFVNRKGRKSLVQDLLMGVVGGYIGWKGLSESPLLANLGSAGEGILVILCGLGMATMVGILRS